MPKNLGRGREGASAGAGAWGDASRQGATSRQSVQAQHILGRPPAAVGPHSREEGHQALGANDAIEQATAKGDDDAKVEDCVAQVVLQQAGDVEW